MDIEGGQRRLYNVSASFGVHTFRIVRVTEILNLFHFSPLDLCHDVCSSADTEYLRDTQETTCHTDRI